MASDFAAKIGRKRTFGKKISDARFEPKPDIDFTDRGVGSPLNQASLALKKILDEAAG